MSPTSNAPLVPPLSSTFSPVNCDLSRSRHPPGAGVLVLALVCLATSLTGAPLRAEAPDTARHGFVHASRPGPWGDLVYTRILIEPPDEFLADDYTTPRPVQWIFPGYSVPGLAALWGAAGLPEPRQRELIACTQRDALHERMVVRPTTELVLELTPAARTTIYSALAAFPENSDQQEPFRFRADNADEWFENSGLAPATIARVQALLYRRGTSLLFSDSDLVLPLLPNRAERLKLVKTLARKSTLLVQLRVAPSSDIDALSRYWGHGPRRKDVHALLQSLARRPGGTLIDVVHLLPRFARSHLFTYADASDHPGDINYDCHWTSLNFFNDPPDPRFADADYVRSTLENGYAQVTDGPLLGDVLVFFRPDGRAIHSCVYVADEIVFTKNGSSQVMPWILMDLPDVLAFYPSDPALTIRVFRRRAL